MGIVKTTLELPDPLFRKAKSKAAQQGISLRQLVTEALEEKLRLSARESRKPWMKHLGKLKDLHRETQRIDSLISENFENIEPETWS